MKEMKKAFETLKGRLNSLPILLFPEFHSQVIVKTDASSVAVGDVLSQKKEDGNIYHAQYAIHTIKSAWRNNSACERESLTAIFAQRVFRWYLLSTEPFQTQKRPSYSSSCLRNERCGRNTDLMAWLSSWVRVWIVVSYRQKELSCRLPFTWVTKRAPKRFEYWRRRPFYPYLNLLVI